jgi:transcriptional regulator with XRE-family HTH domain
MNLLERVQMLCSEKGISQRKLESELKLGNGATSKWMKSSPSGDVLQKVADFFSVSIDYLLGRTDIRNSADRISEALEDDEELSIFWDDMKERPELKILFKQTRELSPKAIQQVIRIIKAIEDEEDRENN